MGRIGLLYISLPGRPQSLFRQTETTTIPRTRRVGEVEWVEGDLTCRPAGSGSTTVDVGQNAPDFTMPSDEGKKDPLYEEPEKGPVVLSFDVFDFTGVFTGQLCAMRDAMGELQAHGAKVFVA